MPIATRYAAITALLLFVAQPVSAQPRKVDVVVYGGTAGGVITAVTAAREGARVALLEPRDHLGGMVSGGLGWTDYGKKEVIGGYSLEYFERVGKKYGVPMQWHFEPHVAEEVFKELVKEAGVRGLLSASAAREDRRDEARPRITTSRWRTARRSRRAIFADATYEGDLMAQAGVSYTWGREGARPNTASRSPACATGRRSISSRCSSRRARRDGQLLPEISAARRRRPDGARRQARCRPTTSGCA